MHARPPRPPPCPYFCSGYGLLYGRTRYDEGGQFQTVSCGRELRLAARCTHRLIHQAVSSGPAHRGGKWAIYAGI